MLGRAVPGTPVAATGTKTFPGIAASAVLEVVTAATVVARPLALYGSAWIEETLRGVQAHLDGARGVRVDAGPGHQAQMPEQALLIQVKVAVRKLERGSYRQILGVHRG